jgi:CRISPR-associated endonuclease/helicase Cas3
VNSYDEFFKQLTGHPPLPYQARIADALLQGRSVVLRAPTGAGKTWASLVPFVYGRVEGKAIADRLIYALPMRTLAAGLHMATRDALLERNLLRSPGDCWSPRTFDTRLQTGNDPQDPRFESDIVFATIDQVLSSYLLHPLGLTPRLDNLNAGVLPGSLLVWDEIHLLEPRRALGTLIEMADRLKRLAQFVFMTATLSRAAADFLARKAGAEILELARKEIENLPSQIQKERRWFWANKDLASVDIASRHRGGRTIALVNSVARAQGLYQELKRGYAGRPGSPLLLLLHARFYPEDRKQVEGKLDCHFGPKAENSNVILITTQAIEAGMDLSCEVLLTEMAPMNALVQRAGRCARYPHRNTGSVYLYTTPSLGPYRPEEDLVKDTAKLLKEELPPEGRLVPHALEQQWVENIHARKETESLAQFDNPYSRRQDVNKAMEADGEDRSCLRQLVRDNTSVRLLIARDPNKIAFHRRFELGRWVAWPRLLSVPYHSLFALKPAFDRGAPSSVGWVTQSGKYDDDASEGPGDTRLTFTPMVKPNFASQWLVALHPEYAHYERELGLLLNIRGEENEAEYDPLPQWDRYSYRSESWIAHAQRVRDLATVAHPQYRTAATKIADACFGSWAHADIVEGLVEIVCLLHDVGKLTVQWQRWAQEWQRYKHKTLAADTWVPLAHTDYEPSDYAAERALRSRVPRPPHAVEGAFALTPSIFEYAQRLTQKEGDDFSGAGSAILSAIARHHAPRAGSLSRYQLDDTALETIRRVWPTLAGINGYTDEARRFEEALVNFRAEGDLHWWALYVFLVRRLRLADQSSLG